MDQTDIRGRTASTADGFAGVASSLRRGARSRTSEIPARPHGEHAPSVSAGVSVLFAVPTDRTPSIKLLARGQLPRPGAASCAPFGIAVRPSSNRPRFAPCA